MLCLGPGHYGKKNQLHCPLFNESDVFCCKHCKGISVEYLKPNSLWQERNFYKNETKMIQRINDSYPTTNKC